MRNLKFIGLFLVGFLLGDITGSCLSLTFGLMLFLFNAIDSNTMFGIAIGTGVGTGIVCGIKYVVWYSNASVRTYSHK